MAVQLDTSNKIVVDLDGAGGNVFYLMALAANLAQQAGLNPDELVSEMKSADYAHAVSTLDKVFGHVVVLQTKSRSLIEQLYSGE